MIKLAKAFDLKRISGKAVSLALITALVSTAALPLASAQAGHRDGWRGGHNGGNYYERRAYKHKIVKKRGHSHGHGGDALAAGVIGFAIGAIIANEANRYAQPRYTYQQPQPIYVQPQPQPIYILPQPQYRPYSEPRHYKSLSHYQVQSAW